MYTVSINEIQQKIIQSRQQSNLDSENQPFVVDYIQYMVSSKKMMIFSFPCLTMANLAARGRCLGYNAKQVQFGKIKNCQNNNLKTNHVKTISTINQPMAQPMAPRLLANPLAVEQLVKQLVSPMREFTALLDPGRKHPSGLRGGTRCLHEANGQGTCRHGTSESGWPQMMQPKTQETTMCTAS